MALIKLVVGCYLANSVSLMVLVRGAFYLQLTSALHNLQGEVGDPDVTPGSNECQYLNPCQHDQEFPSSLPSK